MPKAMTAAGSVNAVDPRMLARRNCRCPRRHDRGRDCYPEARASHWTIGDTVTLRGHDEPTQLALPV